MAHVCPSWLGYFLLNPLRRLAQNPRRLLGPFTTSGMTVLEVGPGMGFFTLELGRLVLPRGRVVAVDIQPRMVEVLRRRVRRANLESCIDVRLSRPDRLDVDDLAGAVDLALAIFVVHEIDDQEAFYRTMRRVLRPAGRLRVVEPPLHVSRTKFEGALEIARRSGFRLVDRPRWPRSKTALLG